MPSELLIAETDSDKRQDTMQKSTLQMNKPDTDRGIHKQKEKNIMTQFRRC